MTLNELLQRCRLAEKPITGDLEVTNVTEDSRTATVGSLFVAIHGSRDDGARFASDAIGRGAVAILSAASAKPAQTAVPWITVAAPREALADAAAVLYGRPAESLTLFGVTGSKGKTTTCFLLARASELAGVGTAMLTTVVNRAGGSDEPASLTTQSAPTIQRLLRRAVDAGDRSAVIEVSSHALDQRRVHGLHFAVGVFTNLFPDHIDYHGTVDHYLAAKRRLFEPSTSARAVVCVDQEAGQRIAAGHPSTVTFGTRPGADVRVAAVTSSANGIRVQVETRHGQPLWLASPLLGSHNAANMVALAAFVLAQNWPVDLAVEAARTATAVPGRMECVARGLPFTCLVDFAHTGPALAAVLRSAREWTQGRLITVFGAGGDRDPERRRTLGEAAAELADVVFLTSDNSRSESPHAIIAAIELAYQQAGRHDATVVVDRASAIEASVAAARPGDTLIIAGRGHEREQLIGDRRIPFDDREVARAALRTHGYDV